jgi:hypothetical protein
MTKAEKTLRELECNYTQCLPYGDEPGTFGEPYFIEGPYKGKTVSEVFAILESKEAGK